MSECYQETPSTLMNSGSLPLHLLIVDDSAFDTELIVLTLKRAGLEFTYHTAATLAAYQSLLHTHSYAAVLSDYQLNGFTAYQTLAILQQSGQTIPLILVTGTLGEEAAVDCIKAGITDYVLKERLFRLPMVLERSLHEFSLRRQQQIAMTQIRKQAKREAIINRITQAMRETLVLDEVMQTTADLLHDVLEVDCCSLIQPGINGHTTVHYVSRTTSAQDAVLSQSSVVCDAYRDSLAQGEAIVLDHISHAEPGMVRTWAEAHQVQAVLVMPLMHHRTFLGAIGLYQRDQHRQWTPDELDLMTTIANQCAIAIHQARLFEQVQRQAEREQLLNQINQTLNSSLDTDYILQEIVNLTGKSFNVDRTFIFAVEADTVHIINEWTATDQIVSMLNFSAPASDWTDLVSADSSFHQAGFLHAPDFSAITHTPARKWQATTTHTRSVLSVPILVRDQLFGGLCLNTTAECRTFNEDEIQLLQRIAAEAAIALYNAKIYEELENLVQKRTQELEREKLLSDAANRAKSEFLTHMSHELRTPLTGILGFSSLLLKQLFGSLNPKQVQYVEGISACGQHLLDLINDLLDLSKIEAEKEELFLEDVAVQEVCEACITMIEEQAHNRGLTLSLTIDPIIVLCTADKRRLRQILSNLLANAVKFTDTGSVRLTVTQDGTNIYFAVIDTGNGISESDQAKLFQSFQQLDSGLARKYEGTGLGLVLARKLAQLHGGDITVTSKVGEGSCFTLRLPILIP